jgi:hypothetical protein
VKVPDAPKKALDEHLTDITLDGVPFLGFAIEAIEEVLSGRPHRCARRHAWRRHDCAGPQRPYWVSYEAEQIINWNVTKIGTGYQLSLVVLKEEVDWRRPTRSLHGEERAVPRAASSCRRRARPATSTSVRDSRVGHRRGRQADQRSSRRTRSDPTRKGKPLTFIPFVFINPTTIRPSIEKPPLLDMVDVNLSHYRSSADYEHGLHFTGLPTRVCRRRAVRWRLAEDRHPASRGCSTGPNAEGRDLEFTGQGLQALEEGARGEGSPDGCARRAADGQGRAFRDR